MGTVRIDLVNSTNRSYRDAVAKGRPHNSYAPTTLLQLAALVPREMDARVRLIDLIREPFPRESGADLLAISSMSCGIAHAYRLADEARRNGTTVVIGGSHATAVPEEAENHADAVVVGYAERSWPQLLSDWAVGRLKRRYTDFSNPFAGPFVRLDRSLLRRKGYFSSATTEASRGCPNSCAFCCTTSLNGGGVHRRPLQDVLRDIEGMGKTVLFLDSNFTEVFPPDGELFRGLAERNVEFYAAGSLKLARSAEAVRLAARQGLRGLLVGFESLNRGSLLGADKSFNDPREFPRTVRMLHDNGIRILGCFVFGFDGDDASVFERTVELAEGARIDLVRYAIATPLPGTRLLRELERQGRIIDREWDHYDTEHVVYAPARMSAEQLSEGYRWAYRESHRTRSILRRLSGMPPSATAFLANLAIRRVAFAGGPDAEGT